MARILGLDIGARSVKALLMESAFRGFTVRSFNEVKLGEETDLKKALSTLKLSDHLASGQVVLAMPGSIVALHLLTLPFADPRRIQATIAFEVEGQLPFDLQDAVFDYQVLQVHDGKSEVLVATVRKEDLVNLLSLLAEAGIDPRTVTTSALAYQGLLAQGLTGNPGVAPLDGAEAIIDIGHERTSVCIARAGSLEYARTFAGGGKELTRAVASEFKVSLADAEAWKENEGDISVPTGSPREVERAAAALSRGLNPVLRELRSTLRAHAAHFRSPTARAYLAGGTSRLKGLDQVLSSSLGLEVLKLDPVPRSEPPSVPKGDEPLAAQAFALAIRGHGTARAARLNLRKNEFAFKGDLDYLKGKVSRLGVFAAILVVLALVWIWAQFRVLTQRESAIDAALCATTTKVIGQCQKDYLIALSLLKGKGSPAASLPPYSALELFSELTSRLQDLKVRLDESEVQLERIRIRGETESFDGVDQIVAALKGFKCFQEIKRGKVQKSKDGTQVLFDLDIRVQCGGESADHSEGA